MSDLEVWGGIECTLNRVGNVYYDQCIKNGHAERSGDFKLFKDLGITRLRYPCLWENVAMDFPDKKDWSKLDQKLNELRESGIKPIAGFLHHGSGPLYMDLLHPEFPEMLADYAGEFAKRYPWIEEYTPINEILTTARFSCLYGHWYPHHNNDLSFLRAVFGQCKATVLAMREIRKIIPNAKLIQPEDIGHCQSTEKLIYQRDFENERRWLAWDILCGKFDNSHPLYGYAISSGITQEQVQWALLNTCEPDILGINHYLLSNRFLDERLALYPVNFHGGNGIHQYADVGVLDTGQAELPSPLEIIDDTWERYHLPLAITEVHTRGHREEQMRWFYQMWNAVKKSKQKGIAIKAITAWSLLGSFDWHSLCTKNEMFYEPGVFELDHHSGIPKHTGLSKLIKDLATQGKTDCPFLDTRASWHSERRILFAVKEGVQSLLNFTGRPIMVDVGNDLIRKRFAKIYSMRNLPYIFAENNSEECLSTDQPWAVLCLEHEFENDLIFSARYIEDDPKGKLILKIQSQHFLMNFESFIHTILNLLIDGVRSSFYYNARGLIPIEEEI